MRAERPAIPAAPPQQADAELDALGLRCPLPVLKARRRMVPLAAGNVLLVRSDDPVATIDIPHFCREDGHTLVAQREVDGAWHFFIRKG